MDGSSSSIKISLLLEASLSHSPSRVGTRGWEYRVALTSNRSTSAKTSSSSSTSSRLSSLSSSMEYHEGDLAFLLSVERPTRYLLDGGVLPLPWLYRTGVFLALAREGRLCTTDFSASSLALFDSLACRGVTRCHDDDYDYKRMQV